MAKNISRITALLLGLTIGFVILGSALFIAENSDHDCTGDNCSICLTLRQCEQNFEKLGTAGAAAIAVIAVVMAFTEAVCIIKNEANTNTLIKLKVELLN